VALALSPATIPSETADAPSSPRLPLPLPFFCRCHSEPGVAAEHGERESRNLLFSLLLLPLPQEPDCTLSSLALAFYYSNQIGSAFRFERADLSRGRVYDNFEKA
jgi:hypothetical protein